MKHLRKSLFGKLRVVLAATVLPGLAIAGSPSSAPTIAAIQNNYGLIPQELPNWGIAPGALFLIKGTALANVTTDLQSSASPGLQTTLQGVKVSVTVSAATVQCFLYYVSPAQIDAVLPGNTPVGSGTLTVTNNGQTSAAAQINVVTSAFGILSYNRTLAAAYDTDNNILTPSNSGNPNQTIVLWGSGVGGDSSNDDKLFPQKQNNLTGVEMHAFVGGAEATIVYSGRSQYPGVDQVVLTIPGNVPTGCYQSIVVVSGSIVSNSTTIPIAASGKTCSDSNVAFTPADLQAIAVKGTVRQAVLGVNQVTNTAVNLNAAPGAFGNFQTIGNFAASIGSNSVSIGSCIVFISSNASGTTTAPLDAGPAIKVSSPAGSSTTLNPSPITFYTTASPYPTGFIPATGGTFAFDNGNGGKDVGHFNATLNFPAAFSWTNQAQIAAVTRTQGVTVTWSGGSGDSYVVIAGSASAPITSTRFVTATFNCEAQLSDGRFAVPPWVTLSMPSGTASLTVELVSNPVPFMAPGLDLGSARALIMTSKIVNFN